MSLLLRTGCRLADCGSWSPQIVGTALRAEKVHGLFMTGSRSGAAETSRPILDHFYF